MVVLCCIVVVTGFLPFPVSRSSLSSPPSQVYLIINLCFLFFFNFNIYFFYILLNNYFIFF